MTSTDVELQITGMTCASCANRIEREAQQARGRDGQRELRDGEGQGDLPGRSRAGGPGRHGAAGRLRRQPAHRGPGTRGRGRPGSVAARPAADLRRADRAGDRDGDGSGAAVHQLAVALPHPRRTGGGVGCLAVPQGRVDQPAARHLDDGHADLDGHAGGARLVALRAVLGYGGHARHDPPVRDHRRAQRRRRQHLLRGRRRGDDVHPGRPLLRGPLQAPGRRGAAGAARAGRQGRRRTAGMASRRGFPPSSWRSATCSSSGPARRSPPTAWSSRVRPPWTRRC